MKCDHQALFEVKDRILTISKRFDLQDLVVLNVLVLTFLVSSSFEAQYLFSWSREYSAKAVSGTR